MADRASQVVGEALAEGTPSARSSQSTAEALASGSPGARSSQSTAEALASGFAIARVSQLVVSLLIRSLDVAMPPIYPSLPGLGYSVFWSPQFFNLDEAAAGVELDLALAGSPTHDFELTYDFLRGAFAEGGEEFKTFMGFWLRMGGQRGRFLFENPKDKSVKSQAFITADGINNQFGPIVRTFGSGVNSGTEPVGYVNPTETFTVYIDGNLQDASSYQLIQTTPGNQQLKFSNTPTAGKVVTLDMSYYYYCKFIDNQMSFEQFMDDLWSVKKVTLRSLRPGA